MPGLHIICLVIAQIKGWTEAVLTIILCTNTRLEAGWFSCLTDRDSFVNRLASAIHNCMLTPHRDDYGSTNPTSNQLNRLEGR